MASPSDNPYQPPSSPTSAISAEASADVAKIRSVAKAQRLLNIAILLYLLLIPANVVMQMGAVNGSVLPLIIGLAVLGIFVFVLFTVGRMAYTMHGVGHAILYCCAMLIPLLGIILLVFLNSRTTKFLTANGVKVGLMGADQSTVP